MKKLITLILLLTGMVCTASAKTIYIQDSWNFKNEGYKHFCVYIWNGTNTTATEWPGNYLIKDGTAQVETVFVNNERNDNQLYYKVDLGDCANFKFHNYYDTDKKESTDLNSADYYDGGFYTITTGPSLSKQNVYNYNLSVSTVGDISLSNVYLWTGSGGNATKLVGEWPGDTFNGASYRYYSYSDRGTIYVIFNQGNNSGAKQTVDMTAVKGDNSYLIKDNSGEKYDRVESVTTNAYGYCTYVNTNPLTISNATAYYAVDGGNGSATAYAITNPVAGTPMLIKGDNSTTYYFAVASTGTALENTNAFHAGTGEAVSTGTGPYNYILNDDAFYLANGKTVATNKAYLQLSAQATARALIFPDDESTGISAVAASTGNTGAYYNLSGQRVAAPARGLYIKDGKKVMVK